MFYEYTIVCTIIVELQIVLHKEGRLCEVYKMFYRRKTTSSICLRSIAFLIIINNNNNTKKKSVWSCVYTAIYVRRYKGCERLKKEKYTRILVYIYIIYKIRKSKYTFGVKKKKMIDEKQ